MKTGDRQKMEDRQTSGRKANKKTGEVQRGGAGVQRKCLRDTDTEKEPEKEREKKKERGQEKRE